MAGHDLDTYHHGDMDIHEQEATYRGFMGLAKWGSLVLSALILHLTITFCAQGANWFMGLCAALALLVVGFFVLRSPSDKKTSH